MQDEISRRRWEMRHRPQAFKPVEALKAMVHDIEAGDLNPEHIIIVYSTKVGEDERATGYYQAGSFNFLEGMGVLTQAIQIFSGD